MDRAVFRSFFVALALLLACWGKMRKPTVMLVDDDSGAARQIAIALELEGISAETVSDGDAARSRLRLEPPEHDLLLIELVLPKRSVLYLAREPRAQYP